MTFIMDTSNTTVVIVPRERFSAARDSLVSLLSSIPTATPIFYVDGPSPLAFRSWLDATAAARPGMRVLRKDFPISQHEAYNLALPHVETPFAACCDNDVLFHPGWLEKLLACAERTGAWAVTPVYLEKDHVSTRIHMAGGTCSLDSQSDSLPDLLQTHQLAGSPVEALEPLPSEWPTDILEYHAFLIRMAVFQTVGKFDPFFKNFKDHLDFSLMLLAHGGTIRMIKDAQVTFLLPIPLQREDRSFFLTRWCEAWLEEGARAFARKWKVHASISPWFREHRRLALATKLFPLHHLTGARAAIALGRRLATLLLCGWEVRSSLHNYPTADDLARRAADPDIQNPHPEFWTAQPDPERLATFARNHFKTD